MKQRIIYNCKIITASLFRRYQFLFFFFFKYRKDFKEDSANTMYLSLYSSEKKTTNMIYYLYPYHSYKIMVVFVYGDDFKREKYHIFNKSAGITASLVLTFFLLVAAVLCYVRRSRHLRRDGYMSSFIDVLITFCAGGNLRVNHKFERWILGILLIGCFFLTALFFELVLFPSFLERDRNIKTFEELAKVNPPVYYSYILKENIEVILGMLRFV